MHAVLEMHGHDIVTDSERRGFYCLFVYMDGKQCPDVWETYPARPGFGSRVLNPDEVRAWQKEGGAVDDN